MSARFAFSFAAFAFVSLAFASPAKTDSRATVRAPDYDAQVVNPTLIGGLYVPASKALFAWGSDGTILRSDDGRTWAHADTRVAADISRVAADDSGRVMIAVGAGGTILRSEDAGRRWRSVGTNANGDLKTVVFDASRNVWIAAGTNGLILRSRDAGRSWLGVPSQLKVTFHALFVDAATDAVLLGADDGLVGSSNDGGESWHLVKIAMPDPLTPIAGFHRHGDVLLATSALGRFLLSADGARSWDLMQSQTRAFFTDSAFDPARASIVMTGHDGTVLRSNDSGASWQTGVLALDGRPAYLSDVHYDARSKSLIAVGHGGTIARSIDGGERWTRASDALDANLDGLIQDGNGQLVTFGNGGLLARSADSGDHWTLLRENLDLYLREAVTTPQSDAFIATGQLGDILRSADGARWERVHIAYPDVTTPPDLRALIALKDGLIAAGPPGAIVRSDARGAHWKLEHWTPLESGRAFPAVVHDRKRNAVLVVEAHGAMLAQRDGERWQQANAPPAGEYWQGAVLERDGVIIVAGKAGSLARSNDSGMTWTRVDAGTDEDLYGVFADDSSASLFVMGGNGTLRRSTDGAMTWSIVETVTTKPLRRMLRDPRSGALICIGGGGVILRSTDAGRHWTSTRSGVDVELRKALIEPHTGNLLIAGRSGVLLRSLDAGLSWQRLFSHTTRSFTSIAASSNGELVAVGERIVRLTPREQP